MSSSKDTLKSVAVVVLVCTYMQYLQIVPGHYPVDKDTLMCLKVFPRPEHHMPVMCYRSITAWR